MKKRNQIDPLEWIGAASAEDEVFCAMNRQLRQRRRRIAMAGSVAGALLIALLFLGIRTTDLGPSSVPPVVHAPERRALPDGSVIELKEGASIAIVFAADRRHVTLQQGEAHFQVAPDPSRPFIVAAGGVDVRAVGTGFSVQLGADLVEVLVTEGRVTVAPPRAPSASEETPEVPVEAGNYAAVELSPTREVALAKVQSAPARDMDERLAWRVARLEFSGTMLAEAIPLIAEHSRVRLVLADERLAKLRLSGILRADNIETLLEILAEAHGLVATRRSATEIVISRP